MIMAVTEQERTNRTPLIALAWTWVALPFLYGVYELIQKVTQLFTG
jgi:hypothetical protein